MKKVVVIGGGGHAKVVTDIIRLEAKYTMAGIIDNFSSVGSQFLDYAVIGKDSDIPKLMEEEAIWGGVIAIGDNALRAKIEKEVRAISKDFVFINCVHPRSIVAKDTQLGEGNVLMAGAVINPATQIGNHCVVNTNVTLEHDITLKDFSSMGPGSVAGGNVTIGKYSAIGLGASIIHGLSVGDNCIIGAGSTVSKDTQSNAVYYGTPATFIKEHTLGAKYL